MNWQAEEVSHKFGIIMDLAIKEGPQVIVGSGAKRVYLISENEYRNMKSVASTGFKDFLMSGPSLEGIDLARDADYGRDIEL